MEIIKYKNLNNLLTISWQLTMKCNYNCPYCSQINEKNKFDYFTQEQVENMALKIKELILFNNKKIRIHLTGGEPSIFNLKEIIKKIDNPLIDNYSITTNLSRDLIYYYKLSRCVNKKISFSASLHETECNYDDFIRKANLIPRLKVYMVATKENKEIINEASKKLKKEFIIRPEHNTNFELIAFSNVLNNRKGNYAEIEDKNGKYLFSNQSDIWKKYGSINFNGYSCKRDYFKIKPNGDIYNGSCSFIVDKEPLGNVLFDKIYLEPKFEICNSNINCNLCGKIEVIKNDN